MIMTINQGEQNWYRIVLYYGSVSKYHTCHMMMKPLPSYNQELMSAVKFISSYSLHVSEKGGESNTLVVL